MIVSAIQTKGGSGKTTLACHLAGWLAERGRGVVLLDADPQRAALTWINGALPHLDVFTAGSPDDILDDLPALSRKADFVVCDGPAGSSEPSRALLLRSDLTLIPCGPSVLDLRALHETARIVEQVRSIRDGKPAAVVVLNRMQPHTNLSREVLEAAPACGLDVARAAVKQRAAIADSAGQSSFVWRMGWAAKEAAEEMEAVFSEVMRAWLREKRPAKQ